MKDNETFTIEEITVGDLLPCAMDHHERGYRLMQACAVSLGDNYQLSYSFVKGYDMENVHLTVPKDQRIPSISHVYECAFLYENEMAELFGVNIQMITNDYHGRLYRIEKDAPFKERG